LWKDRALAAEARAEGLLREARRFYEADGTYRELDSPEEAVEKRIAAARALRDEKGTREGLEQRLTELREIENAVLVGVPGEGTAAEKFDRMLGHAFEMHQALNSACCSYCGEVIPKSADHAIAREHMEICEKHPLAAARREAEEYRMRLAGALGAAEGNLAPEFQRDPNTLPYLKACPTIGAVLKLRAEVEAVRSKPPCCGEGCEPKVEPLPCPVYPDEHMAACPQALHGGGVAGEAGDGVCAEASSCHETLKQKAPALLQLHLDVDRVAGP